MNNSVIFEKKTDNYLFIDVLDSAENMIIYNFIFTPLLAVVYSIGLLLLIRLLKKYNLYKLLFGK